MILPRIAFIIFCIAFFLRMGFIVSYPQMPINGDALAYEEIALNISELKGIVYNNNPNIFWSPGYPIFIAVFYYLFGHNVFIIRIIQAILSTLTVVLIFKTSKKITNYKVATIAAGLSALYPPFIGYTGYVLTETLFIFILVFAMFLAIFVRTSKKVLGGVMLGVIFGFGALIRSEVVLVPFIFFISILFFRRDIRRFFRFLIPCCIGIIVVLAPWTFRNYKIYNRFIPLTIHDADILWASSYKGEWLEYHPDWEPYKSLVATATTDIERANILRKDAIKNIKDNPLLYLKFCLKRSVRYWIGGQANLFSGLEESTIKLLDQKKYIKVAIKISFLIIHLICVLLGFVGIYIGFRLFRKSNNQDLILALASIIIFKWILHSLLFATPRYNTHVMPFMLFFSAITFYYLMERKKVLS